MEGLPLSREWFAANLGRHVEGLHLVAGDGRPIGHIYWAPAGQAIVPYRAEEGVACLYCEWVQTDFQGRGHMRRLFDAWLDLLAAGGLKGILAVGTGVDGYMHAGHFARRGFYPVLDLPAGRLMYRPLARAGSTAVSVEPLVPHLPSPLPHHGDSREGLQPPSCTFKVRGGLRGGPFSPLQVLIIGMHFCPAGASAVLATRRVAAEFGDRVALTEVPAGPEAMAGYGVADGIFVDGRPIFFGPMADDQVRRSIAAALEAHRSP